jgi:hypothetical protein
MIASEVAGCNRLYGNTVSLNGKDTHSTQESNPHDYDPGTSDLNRYNCKLRYLWNIQCGGVKVKCS